MAINPPAGYQEPAGAWAAQYVKKRFGRVTTIVESQPTVTTATSAVLKPNPRRFGWLIFNLGAATVNMVFTQAATVGNGFPLQPLGGGASAEVDEDGELPTLGVNAAAISGTNQLYVLEIVGV